MHSWRSPEQRHAQFPPMVMCFTTFLYFITSCPCRYGKPIDMDRIPTWVKQRWERARDEGIALHAFAESVLRRDMCARAALASSSASSAAPASSPSPSSSSPSSASSSPSSSSSSSSSSGDDRSCEPPPWRSLFERFWAEEGRQNWIVLAVEWTIFSENLGGSKWIGT